MKRLRFGAYILDAEEKVLLRDGKVVPIPPKVLELLLILVENHGHVVEKEALMSRLWADTFVEESNLTFSIRKLRKILGDDTRHPQFIETVPKRGYRFVASTRLDADPSDSDGRQIRRNFGPAVVAAAGLVAALASVYLYLSYRRPPPSVDWTAARSVQLTEQAGTEFFPSLSPDGKSFVYAAGPEGNQDVYLQRVGGRNASNLTPDFSGDDTHPSFSPDGEHVAFRSERDGGGIFIMGISRENLRRVSDFGYHPAWSPDGRHLVVSTFSRDRITVSTRGEQGLWIIDTEDGEKRQLLSGLASFPSWSPGGKRIAYWHYANRSGQSDVATIAAGGGEPVPVAEGFGSLNWNPVWSPDGNSLYFVSNRGGSQGFWRVRINEDSGQIMGEPEPIATPSKFSRHLTLSGDETRMVYAQTDLQSNIQGVEFDPQKLVVTGSPFWITEGDREVSRAELSPDGSRFQMRLVRRTQDDIATVARDGTDWRDVTNDLAFDRYSRWSPDGARIAFTSDRSGGSEIWICNADGASLRQLTFAGEYGQISTFPVWSPEGSRLIFSSPTDSYIVELDQAAAEQARSKLPDLDNGDVFVPWDWSPDGQKLAGRFRPPRLGMGLFSFETGRYTRLSESGDGVPSWLPDSRHLVYSEGNKLILFDTATLRNRELITTSDGEPRSPFVSRDGRLLYYVVHKNESDIWMLELADPASGATP